MRISRGTGGLLLPSVVALLVLTTSACSDVDDPPADPSAGGSSTSPPGTGAAADPADPQVLSDVIDATFEAPGKEMRRAIRLLQFLRDKGIQECGGQPGSLDATFNREDQSRFPDLDLIRQRGLTEQQAGWEEDQRLEQLDASCEELEPELETYDAWRQVQDSWYDVVLSAEQSAPVQDEKPALSACLSEASGREISPADPVNEFLRAVNDEVAEGADAARQRELSTTYADCADAYFGALRKELFKSRDEFVDRNREVLMSFVSEVVAAGYVP